MSFLRLCALSLCLAGTAQAATFSVGPSGCTHTTLDAALDAAAATAGGPHLVKVAIASQLVASDSLTDLLTLTHPLADIDVVGGYANCAADTPGAGRSTIGLVDEAGQLGRVMRIDNSGARRTITLRKLALVNARATGFPLPNAYGGGVRVAGNIDLILDDVDIRKNRAVRGGGIAVLNGATVELRGHSAVSANTAESTSGMGGGIYCNGVGSEVRLATVQILGNHSSGNGGAIHLDQCALLSSVDDNQGGLSALNFQNNTAGDGTAGPNSGDGGAIYSNATPIHLNGASNTEHHVWFYNNSARNGGAIYYDNGSGSARQVLIESPLFAYNTAHAKGGAIHARNEVFLWIGHNKTTPCAFTGEFAGSPVTVKGCSLLLGNRSANAGAATTAGGGVVHMDYSGGIPANPPQLWIEKSTLRFNQDTGTAAVVHAYHAQVNVLNSILADNTAGGNAANPSALLRLPAPGPHYLRHSTVLGNGVSYAGRVLNSLWDITGSIVHSPTMMGWTNAGGGSLRHRGCLLRHPMENTIDDEEVAPGILIGGTWQNDIRLDADYRPLPDSRALDACASSLIGPGTDHDGQAYGFDYPGVVNYPFAAQVGGDFVNDLGALERGSVPEPGLFEDGFEDP